MGPANVSCLFAISDKLKHVLAAGLLRTYSKMAIDMMEIYGANHSVMKLKNIESTRNL